MRLKYLFIVIIILLSTFVASGQYFEFTGNSDNGFQQGCNETYDIYFDTEAQDGITTAQALVKFDNLKIDHVTGTDVTYLRNNLFDVYKSDPAGMVADVPGFPRWRSNYDKIILDGQNDDDTAVSGYREFGSLKFKPKYNYTTADFVFIYSGINDTVLNDENGDTINPAHQNSHLTGTINIEKKPCLGDFVAPSIHDNNYTNGTSKVINNGVNVNFQELTSQGLVPYARIGGIWTGNSVVGRNNQYGVDSGANNYISFAGNGQTLVLYSGDFARTPSNKTREDKDRDYTITAAAGQVFDFGVEKPIAVSYHVVDRVGNDRSRMIHFNAPVPAEITNIYPANNQRFVVLDDEIKFKIYDDWAGVDSGSVIVTLSGLDNDYFGVYSGIDLNFSGVAGVANFPDYDVVLNHSDFPTSGTINVNIYGTDLENNGGDLANWNFTTRPDCSELSCCSLKLQTGDVTTQFDYMNLQLYISGGNDAFLTGFGDLTGYIDCNTRDEGLSIYKGHGDNNTGVFMGFHDLSQLRLEGTNVKAVLSGNTIVLTRITNTTPPGGGGGGGGGTTVPRDNCPEGDFSVSYYDGSCGVHDSPGLCEVDQSDFSAELKGAYLYSYMYGITTMCPIQEADIDGYLHRNHFSKMISEFAVNVLGREPNVGKTGCDSFNDISGDTEELQGFIKTACELNLMGLHSDGITPKESFYSEKYVTRAQFGTVFSRLLFGSEYNVQDESQVYQQEGYRYKDHLQALKEYGVMTKIDGDWPNIFELRGWVMLMMQRADMYGLFEGMIPALNGINALFN